MARSLDGVRIVVFGASPAAAMTAMLLGEHGAGSTVVRRPGASDLYPLAQRTWRRGQHEVELDLSTPDGGSAARQLVAAADVVVDCFKPGAAARLGFGAEALRSRWPALIHCALPGFSDSDVGRRALPGWEGLVQAATAASHPWFEGAGGGEPPTFNALPVASSFAAFHAATAIPAALLRRERTGRGESIEVSLYAAMYTALGALGMRIHDIHSGPNQVINFVPLVRQYQCADGRWLQIHAFTRRAIRKFAQVAGVEPWIAEGVLRLGPVIADAGVRATLQFRLELLFQTRPAQVWEDELSAAGVSAAVCRTTSEWLQHPQASAAGGYGGPQVVLSAEDPMSASADTDGEARADTARRLPPASTDGHALPLEGVRVLDLCIVLAGTTCGRTLAEYGADVIKIDDPNRDGGVIFHNDVNRGKRSLLLDLKTAAGIEVFWRLVEDADVVVENFRAGVVERLGIDYEAVHKRRPGIVYVSLNTYGYEGPWRDRPGWEQLAEAATGMQSRYGGDGRPTLQPYALLDFGTGLMAAGGAMLALLQRVRSGVGQHVTTSLIATAATIQSALSAIPEVDAIGGLGNPGPSPLHRFYEASDGWLFLAAVPGDASSIGTALGIDGFDQLSDAAAALAIEAAVGAKSCGATIDVLAELGVAAVRLSSIDDVMRDPWAVAYGISLQRPHGELGVIDTVGPVPRFSGAGLRPGRPATYPGIDAREVLGEAGFTALQIDALIESRIIVVPAAQ